LTDIVGYSGHAVRGFLSLKSMESTIRRQRSKQNGDYRSYPWRRCGCSLIRLGNTIRVGRTLTQEQKSLQGGKTIEP